MRYQYAVFRLVHTYHNGPDGPNALLGVGKEPAPGQGHASMERLDKMVARVKRKPSDNAIHMYPPVK